MFCGKCGKEVRNGAAFCRFCGTPTGMAAQPAAASAAQPAPLRYYANAQEENLPAAPGNKKRSKLPLVLALVALLFAVAGGVFAFFVVRGDVEIPFLNTASSGTRDDDTKSAKSDKNSKDADDADDADAGDADDADAGAETDASGRDPRSLSFDEMKEICGERDNHADITFVSSDVSAFPLIRLYFQVRDQQGEQIVLRDATGGLKETISGGAEIERTIRSIQMLEGNEGLSIDIVADKSGSMENDLARMQQIMLDFVRSLDYGNGDRAELISFDSFVMYMCTHTQDVSLLENGIANMTAYGATALYDALMEGVRNAAAQPGARCVIAFTDGEDNESVHTAQEVIDYAAAMDVPLYIIGFGAVNATVLEDIASRTGGRYWHISDILDLNEILKTIYREQKGMYCVEYLTDTNSDAMATREVEWVFGDDLFCGTGATAFTPQETVAMMQHAAGYEVIKGDVSWTEANAQAVARGGHLITITSEAEQREAVALAKSEGLRFVWIGGYTSVRNGGIFGHWVTGEPFSYTAWYDGEPSRNDKDGTPEMYLMLWNVREDEWTWNDQRNDPIGDTDIDVFKGKTGYIIEWE